MSQDCRSQEGSSQDGSSQELVPGGQVPRGQFLGDQHRTKLFLEKKFLIGIKKITLVLYYEPLIQNG